MFNKFIADKSLFSQTPFFEKNVLLATYHVSGSAPFALGHYPSDAIFPGVMSLHCMKTLSEILFHSLTNEPPAQVQLKRISYLDVIRPGDVLTIHCKVKKHKNDQWHLQAEISANSVVKSKSSFVYTQ